MLSWSKIGSFGVEVSGVDLSRELNADTIRQIIDLTFENHVSVFRGQNLDKFAYERIGRLFGEPALFFFLPDIDPDNPTLMTVSNSPDIEPYRREGAVHWHTDLSYEPDPAIVTMLMGVEAPDEGGETMFADTSAAYDGLPEATKARIEGLVIKHRLTGGERGKGEVPVPDGPVERNPEHDPDGVLLAKRTASIPHPMVLTHPLTGRKSLYAICGTGFGVEGMEDQEGRALLAELKQHVLQPQFRISVKVGRGDIAVWDNLSLTHSGSPIEYTAEAGKRRLLLRYTTKVLPPIYADRLHPFVAR